MKYYVMHLVVRPSVYLSVRPLAILCPLPAYLLNRLKELFGRNFNHYETISRAYVQACSDHDQGHTYYDLICDIACLLWISWTYWRKLKVLGRYVNHTELMCRAGSPRGQGDSHFCVICEISCQLYISWTDWRKLKLFGRKV